MDSSIEEKHFETLDEYIKDDDKIVTIPSLSRILNIPIVDSQHILSEYVKKRNIKSDELSLTYVLTGTIKENGKAVIIVEESNLAAKRTSFDKVESEVLFSVQKCKKIDFNVLSLVDDVTVAKREPLLGSIVSKNCIKRALKIKKLPPPQPTTVKGKSSHFLSKSSPVKPEKSAVKSEDKSKGNGILNMFDKAAPPAGKSTSEKKPLIESTKNKQKNGISAFFSKSTSTSNISIKSETSIKTENSTSNDDQPHGLEELMEVDFKELDEEENKIKANEKDVEIDSAIIENDVKKEKKKESKKHEVKEKKTKNKRRRDNSEEKNLKKRKRIIQRNDSESDDMFENDEEDVIEKSDDEIERAPSPVKPLAPKNKIRKAVDKTYMDDEGFLVTKTEYVFESAPEDDDEVPIKKETTAKPKFEKKTSASSETDVSPTKNSKGKKGKKNNSQNQPTLMNFFKKK
ncbi:DNA polymerase delta subunit 3 [Diorhabda carinulata]|uniref:DNA polymerase delta subunit 3 n=1 Tax=Diorhabda carinulata TaxID=1163345 RepID=UPI0025A2C959|nr:DNA polymerase delta subunit 3 [Diorhabda carinulata]